MQDNSVLHDMFGCFFRLLVQHTMNVSDCWLHSCMHQHLAWYAHPLCVSCIAHAIREVQLLKTISGVSVTQPQIHQHQQIRCKDEKGGQLDASQTCGICWTESCHQSR